MNDGHSVNCKILTALELDKMKAQIFKINKTQFPIQDNPVARAIPLSFSLELSSSLRI